MHCHSDRASAPSIHKFGGSSLADAERFREAARLVAEAPCPVVVVSAMGGVTERLRRLADAVSEGSAEALLRGELDALEAMHHDVLEALAAGSDPHGADVRGRLDALLTSLHRRLTPPEAPSSPVRFRDEVWSHGEDLSAELMAAALRAQGLAAEAVDARNVVRTDDAYGQAVPRDEETYRRARERILPLVGNGVVPVLQGFIGATEDGVTTTLGRGGSDFTAVMIGAALGGSRVTLWTDVDGVFSADPQVAPEARIIGELGFEEAVELAYFGARVVHPAAAKHAVARNVSLHVRNSFRPEAQGTLVRHDLREGNGVAAVAHRPGVTLIRVRSRPLFMAHGFLARVFDALSRLSVPVDMVATSHTSTAFTVDAAESVAALRKELEQVAEVEVLEGMATVTVVGRSSTSPAAVAPSQEADVELISRAGNVSLSFVVPDGTAPDLVRRLHSALIEDPGHREVAPSEPPTNR